MNHPTPYSPDSLLAFCHIEKAAGTSLTHILRRVFFLRYAAVRPLHERDTYYFTERDLKTVRSYHPGLLAFGGHSVVPHGSFLTGPYRFITQLRSPVARCVSQYRFWISRLRLKSGTDAYLQHSVSRNFQVKKIAGSEDLELAKQLIRDRFLVAGTVESFDEFLVLLAQKIGIPLSWLCYYQKNVSSAKASPGLPASFFKELEKRNELDQALYEWIGGELFSEYVASYPGDFRADLERFRGYQAEFAESVPRRLADSLYRNAYQKPLSGAIRIINGLPYGGSYSIE